MKWLPMLKDGQLFLGEFDLPVCMEQLPPSYSMLSPEVGSALKTNENLSSFALVYSDIKFKILYFINFKFYFR